MLGYWKWLYKVLKNIAKQNYSFLKTNFAKQIWWLIFDFGLVVGLVILFGAWIILSCIVFIIGGVLLLGHVIYLDMRIKNE